MSITLSHEEIVELTGYALPAWQIKWLNARGWTFEISAGGKPKVSRRYYEQKMGVEAAMQAEQEPDFSIFHKAA